MPNQFKIHSLGQRSSLIAQRPGMRGQRPGMIMVFVIVIMMITSLMGLIILVNTRSEVLASGRHRLGLEAFNSADSAAKMANLFARVLLHPVLDSPDKLLTTAPTNGPINPMTVEFNKDRFNMEIMFQESTPFNFQSRYLETGVTNSPTAEKPHIVFKIGDDEVATAVITLDSSNAVTSGYSLNASDLYDKSGGPSVPVDMVVTVKGVTNPTPGSPITPPRSLITTIMRELL